MNDNKTSRQAIIPFEWYDRIITHSDYHEILGLLNSDVGKPHIAPSHFHKLFMMITLSEKCNTTNISEKIIRLNSEFILVTENNIKQLVRIVLPQNIHNSYDISIYNPIAIACLGSKEGSRVCFQYKNSLQYLYIEKSVEHPLIIKPTDLTELLEIPYKN
ncbi:hypothetical protein [uncultured Draconibacterium sp.]|uniref:hypothetical protein n=1 Tax=uncultured Draconibacterium sp. TaxID=1573823 RepID=UPI0025F19B79|nr:hypothetical protein [uncultured Draconibacterium sp.]